ncbi:MAG: RDD family protein [Ginsengibacter sp.]
MIDTREQTVSTKKDKILVYFLAAPEDQQECVAIKKYLSPVLRNSRIPIEINSDFEIPAGEETEKYKQRLFAADIVLAFISADFIDNEDIYQRTKKVIGRYNNNETIMLPILVRNCLWKSTPFVNLPLLPKNFQPLNNRQFWNSADDALTAVVTDIYQSINAFSEYAETHSALGTEQKSTTSREPQPNVAATGLGSVAGIEANPQNFVNPETVISPKEPLKKSAVPLEENWRRQYYSNLIWKRGAAFFLDNFLVLFPAYILPFIFAGVILGITGREELTEDEVNSWMIIAFVFYFVVCAAMESSKWRGTFGKRIMKLQITDREGHPISFFRAFWRNIVRALVGYSYILVFPLIIQYFTFKKTKKLFHDQLSNTIIGEKLRK